MHSVESPSDEDRTLRHAARISALEARVADLPCWKGAVTLQRLHGGLSNVTFVVADGFARYVARCGADIPVHHVYRDRERAASIAAHAAGLSPELVYAEPGLMVVRHIAGTTLVAADMPKNIARIVPLVRSCHRDVARHLAGPASMFWAFHVIRDNVRTLAASGNPAGADIARFVALADALEAKQMPLPIVFGHHDLLPANFIDDGSRIWLIDWEFGGFGTCMFDLANLSSNGQFSAADDRQLLEAYFDGPVRGDVQRLHDPPDASLRAASPGGGEHLGAALRCSFDAMKVASALREATWALVSSIHLDVPGADYRAHAIDYLARTEVALAQFEERHGRL